MTETTGAILRRALDGVYLNGRQVKSGERMEFETYAGGWFPIYVRLEGGPNPDLLGYNPDWPKFAGGGEIVFKLPPTVRFRWPDQ